MSPVADPLLWFIQSIALRAFIFILNCLGDINLDGREFSQDIILLTQSGLTSELTWFVY